MLNGKELGRAIAEAIELKIASGSISSKADVARHFKIKPPSVHGWIDKGAISKSKLPELWRYFSDVVGPEHWGLESWPLSINQKDSFHPAGDYSKEKSPSEFIQTPEKSDSKTIACDAYRTADPETKAVVDFVLQEPDAPLPGWANEDMKGSINTMRYAVTRWMRGQKKSS